MPNVLHESLGEQRSLQIYEAFQQRTPWTMYLVVRGTLDPRVLVPALPALPALRAEVAAVDPEIPLGIAIVACLVPAWRATRADPLTSLRAE